MRKPWMRDLQSYRFTADGCMLKETAAAHRAKNSKDATCTAHRGAIWAYAKALGITYAEARKRIEHHKERLGQ